MITALALLSRPEMARNLRDNWTRQVCPERRLVVVENGRGVGACASVGLFPDLLLEGPEDVVELRNQALDAARRLGGGAFAFWDDDDWYGRYYLLEQEAAITAGCFAGKIDRFVRTRTGLWLFSGICSDKRGQSLTVSTSTLAGRVEDAVEFAPNTYAWGEDSLWCERMFALGYRVNVTSRFGYSYTRGNPRDHLWPAAADELGRLWQDDGGTVSDCGAWDPEVVEGHGSSVTVRLDLGTPSPFDDPSTRAAARELGWC
jgi:hypothetical protein